MSFENKRIEQWLVATLTGDATITDLIADRVYSPRAPEGAVFPLIVFNFQSGEDVSGLGTKRVLARQTFQIKVICRDAVTDDVDTLCDRIDVLINAISNTTSDGFTFSARRLQLIDYPETDVNSARLFFHRGGYYRFDTHTA